MSSKIRYIQMYVCMSSNKMYSVRLFLYLFFPHEVNKVENWMPLECLESNEII